MSAAVAMRTLEEHEAIIQTGLQTFIEVGEALMAIRDGRLYRATHSDFDTYCRERWGFSRRRAGQMIEAAEVGNMLPTPPENARQAAALAPLKDDPAAMAEVMAEVAEEADKVTARAISAKIEARQLRKDIGRLTMSIQQHANSVWTMCLEARLAGDTEVWEAGQDLLALIGQMLDQVISGDIDTVRTLIAEAEA